MHNPSGTPGCWHCVDEVQGLQRRARRSTHTLRRSEPTGTCLQLKPSGQVSMQGCPHLVPADVSMHMLLSQSPASVHGHPSPPGQMSWGGVSSGVATSTAVASKGEPPSNKTNMSDGAPSVLKPALVSLSPAHAPKKHRATKSHLV